MRSNRFAMDAEPIRLPQPPPVPMMPGAFMFCAVGLFPGQSPSLWFYQQWVYQQAFELAQAVVRPSIMERDLLGVWN